MTRRMGILVVVLIGLLLVVVAQGYSYMSGQRDAATAAANDLKECQQAAARIKALQARPSVAADSERVSAEVLGIIERAANSAGITTDRLIRITPEPARRVNDTVYKEKPTVVFLKNVTRKQLVTLVHEVVSSRQGLNAKSIRTTAPRPDDTDDIWNAEIVWTYLIYDPPKVTR